MVVSGKLALEIALSRSVILAVAFASISETSLLVTDRVCQSVESAYESCEHASESCRCASES